ncbi:unnamed protein product, partial [Meganyctiphanes norvegica]
MSAGFHKMCDQQSQKEIIDHRHNLGFYVDWRSLAIMYCDVIHSIVKNGVAAEPGMAVGTTEHADVKVVWLQTPNVNVAVNGHIHFFYRRDYPEELKQVYETANRYHFLHTLALLGVPLCKRPKLAGPMLAVGTLIFSGTCYYYALTGSRNVRQYTPYGGMLLIAGWLAMIL